MAKHRLRCRNALCSFEGMMDSVVERSFVKQRFLDKAAAKTKAMGAAAPAVQVQVRCPKCGARWRMRSDQLH